MNQQGGASPNYHHPHQGKTVFNDEKKEAESPVATIMIPASPPPMYNTPSRRASFYQVTAQALSKWVSFETTVTSLEKVPSLVPAEALTKWTTFETTVEKTPTHVPTQALAKWALFEKTFDAIEKVPSLVSVDALNDWTSFEETITDCSFESGCGFENGASKPDDDNMDGTVPEKAIDDTQAAAEKPLVPPSYSFFVPADALVEWASFEQMVAAIESYYGFEDKAHTAADDGATNTKTIDDAATEQPPAKNNRVVQPALGACSLIGIYAVATVVFSFLYRCFLG